jgi:hypothetical protein
MATESDEQTPGEMSTNPASTVDVEPDDAMGKESEAASVDAMLAQIQAQQLRLQELEWLRRESLMTSQELSRARDEIDNLRRSGGGGGGGMRGGGFDSGRGNQMEEL